MSFILIFLLSGLSPTTTTIQNEIILQTKGSKVPTQLALQIADCESDFKFNAKNPSSSALGVFQFTKGTWEWMKAPEPREDYKANIREFIKWFPKYPQWWKECLEKI